MASPRESLSLSRKRASFAKSVGSFVPGLTRKSFEKYGFSTATLLTDWATIAGQELASFTLPERLKWPRNVEAFEDTSDNLKGRPGATLLLRVDGPRAIEVQYQTGQIIQRINAHFGYRAVGDIRFVQAPLEQRPAVIDKRAARIAAHRQQAVTERANHNDNDELAPPDSLLAALDRLHANITRAKTN